ncbi:hypothetical protein D9J59_00140 [Escherichia coli]|nr:hypothetical protein [Escherichia albertii]EEW1585033.1 hypothetical protein [Escherichia coli]EFN6661282.1 hypothetical protein [Escherichia coli O7:H7]EEW2065331.1 hypothetical protein [Escherichia coli]EEX1773207.1 hypothetical protein [Escherichia coli]
MKRWLAVTRRRFSQTAETLAGCRCSKEARLFLKHIHGKSTRNKKRRCKYSAVTGGYQPGGYLTCLRG